MNDLIRSQNADFLSIALEEFGAENYGIAADFIDDVRERLLDEEEYDASQQLQHSLNKIEAGEYDEAAAFVGDVYDELIEGL